MSKIFMQLENQVCSLELANKLKELGIKQDSLFYWDYNVYISEEFKWDLVLYKDLLRYKIDDYISSFTVAELGEILPKTISIITDEEEKKIFSNFRFITGRSLIIEENKPIEVWSVNYICDTTNEFRNWLFDMLLTKPIYDKNEANARAKMLIHLLENGLIKNDLSYHEKK